MVVRLPSLILTQSPFCTYQLREDGENIPTWKSRFAERARKT